MAEVCGAAAECIYMLCELSTRHKDAEDGTVNPRRLRGVAASIGVFSLGCCLCGAIMGPLLLLVALSSMMDDYSTTADVVAFWGFTVAFFAAGVLGLLGIVYAVLRWRKLKPAVAAYDESLPLKSSGDTPGHTNTIQGEPYTHPGYSNV